MKNLKKIITAGLILSCLSTTIQAEDLNALTKATVKLIKDNKSMEKSVQDVQLSQEELSKTVDQQKLMIKTLSDENTEIREILNKTNLNVSSQLNGAKDSLSQAENKVFLNSQKEIKQIIEENKNLKQELATYKMFTDTEIKLMKSKLDNMNTPNTSYKSSNSESNQIIKEFIK